VNAYADALGAWRPPDADAALVSRLFPYAVAFGRTRGWGDVIEKAAGDLPWYVPAEGSTGRETADRIKRLAGMVAPRPWEVPGGRRRGRFGFVDSSGRYDSYYAGSAATYGSGGGLSADAGGGSVGGGDGGGGGGGW
jgi:hypothetical protein